LSLWLYEGAARRPRGDHVRARRAHEALSRDPDSRLVGRRAGILLVTAAITAAILYAPVRPGRIDPLDRAHDLRAPLEFNGAL